MTHNTVPPTKSKRIAAIDWMRGVAMILMMIDHASMAFDGGHFSADSAALALQEKGYDQVFNVSGGFLGVCCHEYFNDKTKARKPIVTEYSFA